MEITKGNIIFTMFSLMVALVCNSWAFAQEQQEKIVEINVMIIVDGSHNMNKYWNKQKKLDILKKVFPQVLQEISKDPSWGFNVGMRSFGEQSVLAIKDCSDSKLRAKIEWFDPIVLSNSIDGLHPKGMSCLSHAIRESGNDFRTGPGYRHHYVVVITSGGDECNMDPIAACRYLKFEKKIIDSLHIVGLNLSKSTAELLKKAAETTDGHFFNVTQPEKLKSVLVDVINYYARARTPIHDQSGKSTPKK